ncbi:MAG: polyribonucleotide nucleotidyltransferase [Rickettsiales bacterium]|nr:polyribonucleotide nucleotidyltransferase [Rickettsiales bacterium]
MFNVVKREMEWGGRTLTLETGRMARQADGAVVVTYGGTTVLCTVCAAKSVKTDIDFFPLTVNYIEKAYATGKVPGGFFKREGRPSEKETLISRLIDRPIRPLFPSGFFHETQVVCMVLTHDKETDSDVPAMIGASAALTLSGVPFLGPIGGANVGFKDGEYILNPTKEQIVESDLHLSVAGTKDAVLMVESQAKELTEEQMLGAVTFGHDAFQPVIDMIISMAEEAAKEPWDFQAAEKPAELIDGIKALIGSRLEEAYSLKVKQERAQKLDALHQEVAAKFVEEEGNDDKLVGGIFKSLEKDIVRGDILKKGDRIDGRPLDKVRQIDCQVGILPKVHGSALFTRGETQALVITTLGTSQDEQIIDALDGEYKEDFMLHYNFPPFSVGEAYPMRPPGRREIGHGKLAYRAVKAMVPSKEDFPYTIRLVSEITESNGSSSMATVCGSSLAMMDAGVPVKRPIAGIAMGLIKEGDDFAVLSDILGDEDHLGDMDFKVAGTQDGITSLQMDIKITGITKEIMEIALKQAKDGRLHILGEMAKALTEARTELNPNAPKISTLKIDKEKIREVIGTGGKVIREICETTGAKIDIDEDGTVSVFAADGESGQRAVEWIEGIVAEPEVGVIYEGKVVRIVDFGAFVNFLGANDGLVHISEIADYRVAQVTDELKEGDMVKVKVLEIDNRGKVRLSMRVVDQETGEDITTEEDEQRTSRRGSGGKKKGA